ncbi:retinitis pigmentosa gtpase regulator a-related [Anaeramoeba flamelloides]|uniref:Retinitis pigmentosa gtpase regulator a-related n=1 Tax=Anaeramoeba flamelloides TaxID=1746091 RepID=A0AAV7ZD62_9EUKA|nr:retinitis pigmentosa gtpase regulator a-related [Anaeramoeba flamelloides]
MKKLFGKVGTKLKNKIKNKQEIGSLTPTLRDSDSSWWKVKVIDQESEFPKHVILRITISTFQICDQDFEVLKEFDFTESNGWDATNTTFWIMFNMAKFVFEYHLPDRIDRELCSVIKKKLLLIQTKNISSQQEEKQEKQDQKEEEEVDQEKENSEKEENLEKEFESMKKKNETTLISGLI